MRTWRRLRFPLLGTALVLAISACAGVPGGTTGGAKPEPVPTLGPGGGLAGGAGFAEGAGLLWGSEAELAQRLDGIAATGAEYVRVDVDWSVAQPGPTSWNWGPTDRVVRAARARGLRVLGLITYTPAWARPPGTPDKNPPSNPADFANFAAAAAARYTPLGVREWEIWNEPNSRWFWSPAPNPAAYTDLLIRANAAIKSVDAGATVMTGGLSPAPDSPDGSMIAPVTFLNRVYAAGGGGHFDAVAHHPYNYPYMPLKPEPNYNWNAFGGVTPKLYETMVANGDGAKKIWGTEMGAPTVQGMTTEYVAAYVTEAFNAWRSWSFTGPLFWYSYRDGGTNPSDPEHNFGLVKTNGVAKEPALTAFEAAAN
ncbi:MAG: cellulase family glycosylhydrolase [Acidimicrobiia bacterium]